MRWREYSRPRYARTVEEREAKPPEDLPAKELLAGAQKLLDAGTEYYTSVQTIIPIAAISEALFTTFYNRLVRREGDPRHRPSCWVSTACPSGPRSRSTTSPMVPRAPRPRPGAAGTPSQRALDLLAHEVPPAGVDKGEWGEWRSRFQTHLDRYGHAVYNLDFVNPVPADDPTPLFDTLKFYLGAKDRTPTSARGGGHTPRGSYKGGAGAAGRSARKALQQVARVGAGRAPVREDALADVGLAWPVMRRMLLELGRRLVEAGAVQNPADVFWLRRDELEDMAVVLDAGETQLASLADAVEQRKMLWRGQRRVTPPQLLPKGTWFEVFERLMPAASEEQTGDTIKGVAASGGQVTAPARVLSGPEDFGQMRPGEVLVAGITTPAWTSLFAMASAVVTDVGGPLSHSSIVAREYAIPAVLGTGVATGASATGQSIRVDGDAGTVTLLDGSGANDAEQSLPEPQVQSTWPGREHESGCPHRTGHRSSGSGRHLVEESGN